MKTKLLLYFVAICAMGYSQTTIRLDQLDLTNATSGWGTVHKNQSVGGNSLKIAGTTYTDGVGLNSPSEIDLKLNGTCTRFQATVGIDDEVSPNSGNLEFQVYADAALVWSSGIMKNTDAVRTKIIDIDITGKKYLSLVSTNGDNGNNWYDHADWVNTKIIYTGTAPVCVSRNSMVVKISNKNYFVYRGQNATIRPDVSTTDPVSYVVSGLPAGLSFNPATQTITGRLDTAKVYTCKVKVYNANGADSAMINIDVMEPNNRRPPLMGWASWNLYRTNISEAIIKSQADALVTSGLSAVGYKNINIDDGFFNGRDAGGNLKIDATKFPNGMKTVVDYIHSKGLKAGFYSEAGNNTCGSIYDAQTGGVGAGLYNHDQQDANLFFNDWGFDFLKVDYCGALNQGLDEQTRYSSIKIAMDNTNRKDINFNVCRWQFPGTWVTSFADSWRISADITASWSSMCNIIDKNAYLAPYASFGHYNDMDMLEIGNGMTATEDKSQFSMWCIMSAPLLLGNNMSAMTQTTKDILTNAEVIAVNQDTTGLQAHLVSDNGAGLQVWAKNLNGKQSLERAVVLFNRSSAAASMSIKWKDLNLEGAATVRDLWLHSDLGNMDSIYTATVPSHGVVMLKVVGTKARLQDIFEAEYAWINNYNLTQNAAVVANQGRATTDATCSGRAKASWLGNNSGNWIEFRDVFANKAGSYTLKIYYISADSRNMTVSINGQITELSGLNSGGAIGVVNVPVNLNMGSNTIRLSNATGWMPDVDKISVNLNDAPTTEVKTAGIPNVKVFPNPAKDNVTVEMASFPASAQLRICNVLGQTLENIKLVQNKQTISLKNLIGGIYMIRLFNAGSVVYDSKLVVCRN